MKISGICTGMKKHSEYDNIVEVTFSVNFNAAPDVKLPFELEEATIFEIGKNYCFEIIGTRL